MSARTLPESTDWPYAFTGRIDPAYVGFVPAEGMEGMNAGRHRGAGLVLRRTRLERRDDVVLAHAQHVAIGEAIAARAARG
ncbi:MAG: hypothetical protein E6K45_05880 [Gammaproteobacteria bacterium]|nr:MAG: hypothetical protein E6K45_05880 [Gammaproteobacteria bacterium]